MLWLVAVVNYGCELEWSGTIQDEMEFKLGPDERLDWVNGHVGGSSGWGLGWPGELSSKT